MSIRELTALVKPPAKPSELPRKPNWKSIEKTLGSPLPADYQEYVAAYGTGLLCNFIIICNPFSTHSGFAFLPFVSLMRNTLANLRECEGSKQVPFDFHPKNPGLLPMGGDENGNGIYWLTEGKPEAWPCIVGEGRGKRWERFDFPMTTFLAKILKKEIRCKVWPASFPGRKDCLDFQSFP